jgi:hypothetical protein
VFDGRQHVGGPSQIAHVVVLLDVAEQIIEAGDLLLLERAVDVPVAIEKSRVIEFHRIPRVQDY